jgi:hypothetical protein
MLLFLGIFYYIWIKVTNKYKTKGNNHHVGNKDVCVKIVPIIDKNDFVNNDILKNL